MRAAAPSVARAGRARFSDSAARLHRPPRRSGRLGISVAEHDHFRLRAGVLVLPGRESSCRRHVNPPQSRTFHAPARVREADIETQSGSACADGMDLCDEPHQVRSVKARRASTLSDPSEAAVQTRRADDVAALALPIGGAAFELLADRVVPAVNPGADLGRRGPPSARRHRARHIHDRRPAGRRIADVGAFSVLTARTFRD
jgi:hypothetical protein